MTLVLQSNTPVLDLLDLVDVVVAQFRRLPAHVSREDLASVARGELVRCMERFAGPVDEARAYAFPRMRSAVLDEIRRMDPLSRVARAKVRLVKSTERVLEQSLGRTPTETELAAAAEIPLAQLRQALALSRAADEMQDEAAIAVVVDESAASPCECAITADVLEALRGAISRLPARHAEIVRRFYFADESTVEIGAALGLTSQRVGQIRDAALVMLAAQIKRG